MGIVTQTLGRFHLNTHRHKLYNGTRFVLKHTPSDCQAVHLQRRFSTSIWHHLSYRQSKCLISSSFIGKFGSLTCKAMDNIHYNSQKRDPSALTVNCVSDYMASSDTVTKTTQEYIKTYTQEQGAQYKTKPRKRITFYPKTTLTSPCRS